MDLDLFKKKISDKSNGFITYDELSYVFNGYLNNVINDGQMTEILKLICKYELLEEEVFSLVDIFIKSGDVLPFNPDYIDKHSTGGVGDKTTLIVLPILSSLGVNISKMSGRALGYTGGTIDKLESIGVRTNLSRDEFYYCLNKFGMVISSQTDNLCPMDKKVYALRDVTGTTKSISLIATSIMSKKIASGAGKILLDVKVGNGALVDNIEDAERLAKLMVDIGKRYNREVVCMLTRMDYPLGNNVGNRIEIMEVMDILQNKKDNDLKKLVVEMSSRMLSMNKGYDLKESKEMVLKVLESGACYTKFCDYVSFMGGNLNINLPVGREIICKKDGYVSLIDALKVGEYSMKLGAGRKNKEDLINFDAGVILNVNVGDRVNKGDILGTVYGNDSLEIDDIESAIEVIDEFEGESNIILELVC